MSSVWMFDGVSFILDKSHTLWEEVSLKWGCWRWEVWLYVTKKRSKKLGRSLRMMLIRNPYWHTTCRDQRSKTFLPVSFYLWKRHEMAIILLSLGLGRDCNQNTKTSSNPFPPSFQVIGYPLTALQRFTVDNLQASWWVCLSRQNLIPRPLFSSHMAWNKANPGSKWCHFDKATHDYPPSHRCSRLLSCLGSVCQNLSWWGWAS